MSREREVVIIATLKGKLKDWPSTRWAPIVRQWLENLLDKMPVDLKVYDVNIRQPEETVPIWHYTSTCRIGPWIRNGDHDVETFIRRQDNYCLIESFEKESRYYWKIKAEGIDYPLSVANQEKVYQRERVA